MVNGEKRFKVGRQSVSHGTEQERRAARNFWEKPHPPLFQPHELWRITPLLQIGIQDQYLMILFVVSSLRTAV